MEFLSKLALSLSILTIFILYSSHAFAEGPIIEKIFSYQPESSQSTIQTVVMGKNLTGLNLTIDKCPEVKSYSLTGMAIFTCEDWSQPSGTYKASLILKNEKLIQNFEITSFAKDDFEKIYSSAGTRIDLVYNSLGETGDGRFSVRGYNLPDSLTIDADCEDTLISLPASQTGLQREMNFSCHKTYFREEGSRFSSFLIQQSPSGPVIFHQLSQNDFYYYIPTVHITPFSTNGISFFEIYPTRDYRSYPDDIDVTADFCKQIWYIPRYSKYDARSSDGESYLCESNGRPPNIQNVHIVYKPTNTILWPIELEKKGSFVFITSDTREKFVMTGQYIRSLDLPKTPWIDVKIYQNEMNITVEGSSAEVPDYILQSSFCASAERTIKLATWHSKEDFWKSVVPYYTVFQCIINPAKQNEKAWIRISDAITGQTVYQNMPFNTSDVLIQNYRISFMRKGYDTAVFGNNLNKNISIFAPFCKYSEYYYWTYQAYDYDCVPKQGTKFDPIQFVIFDEEKGEVYWPIDISKGPSEPLDDFFSRNEELSDAYYASTIISAEAVQLKNSSWIDVTVKGENISPLKITVTMNSCPSLEENNMYPNNYEIRYLCNMRDMPSGRYLIQVRNFSTVFSTIPVDYQSPNELQKKSESVVQDSFYRVDFLYPTIQQNYTIRKKEHTESFVYFTVASKNATNDAFVIVYSIGDEEKTIISDPRSTEPMVITIPSSVVSGMLEIKKVNDSERLLGTKSIAIISDAAVEGELTFAQDRATGLKVRLSPVTSLGGEKDVGGETTFSISEKKSNSVEKTLDLNIGLRKGIKGEFSIGIPILNELANADLDLGGSVMVGQTYDYQYENFKDLISEENYKKFQELVPYFVRARNQYQSSFRLCRNLFDEQTNKGISFIPECETAYEILLKNNDEFDKIKANFDTILEDLREELIKDPKKIQKNIAIFLILVEGYQLSGNISLKRWITKIFRNPKYEFSELDLKSILSSLRRSDSWIKDISFEASMGLDMKGISANALGHIEQLKESTTLFQNPNHYTSRTTKKQGKGFQAKLSGNILSPILKKISSKVINNFVSFLLTKLKSLFPKSSFVLNENVICKILKSLISQKGVITALGKYSDDCRGLESILKAGYFINISLGEADIKAAFLKILGIDIGDLNAQLIAGFLTGSDINLMKLFKYPEKTSYSVSQYWNDTSIKKVIFSVSFGAEDQIKLDEYIFTPVNLEALPKISDSLFVSDQLYEYLQNVHFDPNINIELNRYDIISETESTTNFSIGWGIQLKYSEKSAHEIKVLTEHFELDHDKNLRKVNQIEPRFLEKFINKLKSFADVRSEQNAHIQTILDNLYNIIYISTENFESIEKVPENASTHIPILYH